MKKIPVWTTWDWKSILRVVSVVTVGVVILIFFFKFPDWLHDNKTIRYTAFTSGKYLSYSVMTRPSQGKFGNKHVIEGYTLEYSYVVNGVTYVGKDNIPDSRENLKFFSSLQKDLNQTLVIKYNPDNPEESAILTKALK